MPLPFLLGLKAKTSRASQYVFSQILLGTGETRTIFNPFIITDAARNSFVPWPNKPRAELAISESTTNSISKSQDGTKLIIVQARNLFVYEISTKALLWQITLPQISIATPNDSQRARVSVDNRYVFVLLEASPWYKIYDLNDGSDVSTLLPVAHRPSAKVPGFAFSPNGEVIAIMQTGVGLKIHTMIGTVFDFGTIQPPALTIDAQSQCAFSPDNDHFAITGLAAQFVKVLDPATWLLRPDPSIVTPTQCHSLAWAPDSSKVLALRQFTVGGSPNGCFYEINPNSGATTLVSVAGATNTILTLPFQFSEAASELFFPQTRTGFSGVTAIGTSSPYTYIGNVATNSAIARHMTQLPASGENGGNILLSGGDNNLGIGEVERGFETGLSTSWSYPLPSSSFDNQTRIACDEFGDKVAYCDFGTTTVKGYVAIFDSLTGNRLAKRVSTAFYAGNQQYGSNPAMNKGGTRLVALTNDGVQAFNGSLGLITTLTLPSGAQAEEYRHGEFTNDGSTFIAIFVPTSATAQSRIGVYDVAAGFSLINTRLDATGWKAQSFQLNPLNDNIMVVYSRRNGVTNVDISPIIYDNITSFTPIFDITSNRPTGVAASAALTAQYVEGGAKILSARSLYDPLNSFAKTDLGVGLSLTSPTALNFVHKADVHSKRLFNGDLGGGLEAGDSLVGNYSNPASRVRKPTAVLTLAALLAPSRYTAAKRTNRD